MKKIDERLYRVLDANSNRLREALRVCEDIARFVISDGRLAGSWKRLRHEVTQCLLDLSISHRELVFSRDSEGDCGRDKCLHDKEKEGIDDVFVKNIKRAQEAARVIEEFLKIFDKAQAYNFQKIRFRIYDLEKKALKKL